MPVRLRTETVFNIGGNSAAAFSQKSPFEIGQYITLCDLRTASGWLRGCGCSNPLKYVNPKIWSSLNVDKLFVHYQVHTAYMELLKNISTEVLA